MKTGRPKKPLALTADNKEKLELLARRPKTAQRLALRSKIVLRAVEGAANQEIARALGVTGATVGKWRERFRLQGMRLESAFTWGSLTLRRRQAPMRRS